MILAMHAITAQPLEQVADPKFKPTIFHPAYTQNSPKILFDEAHQNIHTTNGRYKSFVELMKLDGYQVATNRHPFNFITLATYNILVIANALGNTLNSLAFNEQECLAVKAWVKQGGSLLLIADHRLFGAAATSLAQQFGVNLSNSFTVDAANYDRETDIPSFLVFSHQNHLLTNYSVIQGRNESEQINRVITFTGQSLSIPPASVAFLHLLNTAKDLKQQVAQVAEVSRAFGVSAAGRAQGFAIWKRASSNLGRSGNAFCSVTETGRSARYSVGYESSWL